MVGAQYYKVLSAALVGTDNIEIRVSGTATLVDTALVLKSNGTTLGNPFTVADAGGIDSWGFSINSNVKYDLYIVEQDDTLAYDQILNPPTTFVTEAVRAVTTYPLGQIIFTTDTNVMYVGTGTTVGGIKVKLTPDFIDYNTTLADPAHLKGRTFWNGAKNALSYYNQIADVAVNLGQEVMFPVYNGSGATILNGRVVTPDPTGIVLADSHFKHKSRLIAVATHDIPDGTWGYVTRLGQVGGLNTTTWVPGQIIYLGSAGLWATAPPLDGGYSIIVGVVDEVHATEGIITIDTHVSDLTVEVTDTNGFPLDQKDNTSLSVDEGTRTLTFDVITGTEYHFYERGDKYEKENAETTQAVVFDDLEGEHWFYFSEGVFTAKYEPTITEKQFIILNNAFVCTAYWNATDKKIEIDILEERHGIGMSPTEHLYTHVTRGAQYVSGLGLSDFAVDGNGSLDVHAQFEVASGMYFDEDLSHSIPTAAFPASIPVVYNLGPLRHIRSESQTSFPILNAPAGRPYYNEWTGSAWQLTEIPNNQFCLYHVFAVNGIDTGLISIMGQTSHTTRNNARNAAATEISSISANLPFAEFIPLGTFIIQANNSYVNAVKAKIVSTGEGEGEGDYVDWRSTELAQGVAPSSHLNLSNLELASAGVTWGHIDDQAQTIMGVKTFGSFPVGPSSDPTTDYQLVHKKYVNDGTAGRGLIQEVQHSSVGASQGVNDALMGSRFELQDIETDNWTADRIISFTDISPHPEGVFTIVVAPYESNSNGFKVKVLLSKDDTATLYSEIEVSDYQEIVVARLFHGGFAFTAGGGSGGGGGDGNWPVVGSHVSDGTENIITFPLLPGDAYYKLEITSPFPTTGTDVSLYVNGDTVQANYRTVRAFSMGAPGDYGNVNSIGELRVGNYTILEATIRGTAEAYFVRGSTRGQIDGGATYRDNVVTKLGDFSAIAQLAVAYDDGKIFKIGTTFTLTQGALS